jgi:hypothetical protein
MAFGRIRNQFLTTGGILYLRLNAAAKRAWYRRKANKKRQEAQIFVQVLQYVLFVKKLNKQPTGYHQWKYTT